MRLFKSLKNSLILSLFITNLFTSLVYSKERAPIENYWYSYDGQTISARAVGMGGAYVAVTGGADSVYWNPAGLIFVENNELNLMFDLGDDTVHSRDIIDENKALKNGSLLFVSAATKDGAVSWRPLANYRNIDTNGDEVELMLNQYSLSSASQSEEDMIVGMNINYIKGYIGSVITSGTNDEVNISRGTGWGMDWGFLYSKSPNSALGVMIQNAPAFMYWTDYDRDRLPVTLRMGFSSRLTNGGIAAFDFEREYYKDYEDAKKYHIGYEQYTSSLMAIRFGAYGRSLNKPDQRTYTFGVGYIRPMYRLDFAVERYKITVDQDESSVYHLVSSLSMYF